MASQNKDMDVMIQISNVKKRYRLGQIGGGTLQADLQSWWARMRGKEDPNTIIGVDQRSNGETFMALNGIDLTIYKGEAVGIIGGNGAGKSTLLKLLSRVTAPTVGEIDIYGRIASMLEVGTGFSPEMTGRENVYMNGAILGMTKAEIDAKMEDIIEFSEVREFIDTPVKRYSSGMYVKLAFSVAAHLDSEIMIMDEVLAVGDMAFQKKCLDKMREVAKKEGRTILYVSHNMNTIRQLCDRCIVLEKGKVIYDGSVEKGIAVYNGIERIELKTEFNRQELKWPNLHLGKDISMDKLNILEKKDALFVDNEKMYIEVEISTREQYENVHMGMQLYTESKETIGFGSVKIGTLEKGKKYRIRYEYDIANIVEGTYCFRLNIHLVDDTNRYLGSLDQTNYIYFDVLSSGKSIVWHHEWWNNINIKDFKMDEKQMIS